MDDLTSQFERATFFSVNTDVQIIEPTASIFTQTKKNKRTTKFLSVLPTAKPQTIDLTTRITTNSTKELKKECNRLLGVAKICERDMDWSTAVEFYEESATMLREMKNSSSDDLFSLLSATERKISKLTVKATRNSQHQGQHQSKPQLQALEETKGESATHSTFLKLSSFSWSVQGESASLPGDFSVPTAHHDKLFPHQRRGVEWMWSLYRNVSGGILADDMGLGKTVQVVTLLRGMCANVEHRVSIVVSPVSVVPQWKKEFDHWAPEMHVVIIHGMSVRQKIQAMSGVLAQGGVIITTYGQIRSQQTFFAAAAEDADFEQAKDVAIKQQRKKGGTDAEVRKQRAKRTRKRLKHFQYACVVLDEGHIIKNHTTQISHAVRTLPTRQRLILTGTPIQNHLKEIWSLFDWVTDGHLLGTVKEFNQRIASKIEVANEKNATPFQKLAGKEASETLAAVIKPLMLRRTKQEVFGGGKKKKETTTTTSERSANDAAEKETKSGAAHDTVTKSSNLNKSVGLNATKTDVVVWIPLGKGVQRNIYYDFLESEQVKRVLNETGSPLVAIDVLRKVCQHPSLLNKKMKATTAPRKRPDKNKNKKTSTGFSDDSGDDDEQNVVAAAVSSSSSLSSSSNENGIDWMAKYPKMTSFRASSKLCFLMKLITSLKDHGGHRTLIFTSTKLMLNLIEQCLPMINMSNLRIDGETPLKVRQSLVDEFNMNPNIDVFLLTIGVGGVGLTLTGADRVVLFDPSWNPSIDRQAVDRCYRIGQTRDVICYRFVTCGTVEEAMYRRQVFKDGVSSTVMNLKVSKAWSSRSELKRLFSLESPDRSEMCDQVEHLRPALNGREVINNPLETSMKMLGAYGVSYHELVCESGSSHDGKKNSSKFGGKNRNLKQKLNGRRDATAADKLEASELMDVEAMEVNKDEVGVEGVEGVEEELEDVIVTLDNVEWVHGEETQEEVVEGVAEDVLEVWNEQPVESGSNTSNPVVIVDDADEPEEVDEDDDDDDDDDEDDNLEGFVGAVGKQDKPSMEDMIHDNVCDEHWMAMLAAFPDPKVVRSTRCRCHASKQCEAKYKRLIAKAETIDNEFGKLHKLLDAIELIDDDPSLHAQVLMLSAKLGCIKKKL